MIVKESGQGGIQRRQKVGDQFTHSCGRVRTFFNLWYGCSGEMNDVAACTCCCFDVGNSIQASIHQDMIQ